MAFPPNTSPNTPTPNPVATRSLEEGRQKLLWLVSSQQLQLVRLLIASRNMFSLVTLSNITHVGFYLLVSEEKKVDSVEGVGAVGGSGDVVAGGVDQSGQLSAELVGEVECVLGKLMSSLQHGDDPSLIPLITNLQMSLKVSLEFGLFKLFKFIYGSR